MGAPKLIPRHHTLRFSLVAMKEQSVMYSTKCFGAPELLVDFILPHPSELPNLGYTPADLAAMDLLPGNEIVRQSYALALLGFHIDLACETENLEELVAHTLTSQSRGFLPQWVEAFC